MEPITGILAAVSAANSAFTVVKKLVAAGREIEDVAGQIGKWYGAFGDFNRLANERANKKPSVFKRLLHDGSVEQEALQITMHKQALIKQEYTSPTPNGGFLQIIAGDELVFEHFDSRGKQLHRVIR